MALNLRTLGTRSVSGAIFVVLLLGCVWFSYSSFCLFFLAVSLMGLKEFYNLSDKFKLQSFSFVGLVLGLIFYLLFINWQLVFPGFSIGNKQSVVVLFPFIVFVAALFTTKTQAFLSALYTTAGLLYAVLPFTLLQRLVLSSEGDYKPHLLTGVIFLIWSNDTFAYLGGSLFGKNKMIERISPGKTWEGTVFGVLMTFVISFILQRYLITFNDNRWIILGVLVPVLATLGDLVESLLKRQAGVKDTGNIMPGHGGILDRFDSLIFVTPFVYVLLLIYS